MVARTARPADSVPFGGVQAARDVLLRPGRPLFYRIPEVMTMLAMSRSALFEQLRTRAPGVGAARPIATYPGRGDPGLHRPP